MKCGWCQCVPIHLSGGSVLTSIWNCAMLIRFRFRFWLLIFLHTVPVPVSVPYIILRKKKIYIFLRFLLKLYCKQADFNLKLFILFSFSDSLYKTDLSNPHFKTFLYTEPEPEPEPEPEQEPAARSRFRFRFWLWKNDTIPEVPVQATLRITGFNWIKLSLARSWSSRFFL